jgi:hypothetical protein
MTRLADLVATSQQVAGTSGRLATIAALAELLRRLAPDEIAVAYRRGARASSGSATPRRCSRRR